MHLIAIAMAFKCLSDKYGGKIGENARLDKGHQYHDNVNKDGKSQRHRREAPADTFAHGAKYENERNEGDNNNVARHHVGEKTNHEGDRLGKNAQYLNRNHNQLDTKGNRWVENMAPEIFIGAEQDHEK